MTQAGLGLQRLGHYLKEVVGTDKLQSSQGLVRQRTKEKHHFGNFWANSLSASKAGRPGG